MGIISTAWTAWTALVALVASVEFLDGATEGAPRSLRLVWSQSRYGTTELP